MVAMSNRHGGGYDRNPREPNDSDGYAKDAEAGVEESKQGLLEPASGDDAEKGAAADAAPAEGVVGYVKHELLEADPHAVLKTNEKVGDIHANVKHHDAKAEGFFRYVQVFTAMVDSFSHGANDVANAMGPFAAAYVAYKKG